MCPPQPISFCNSIWQCLYLVCAIFSPSLSTPQEQHKIDSLSLLLFLLLLIATTFLIWYAPPPSPSLTLGPAIGLVQGTDLGPLLLARGPGHPTPSHERALWSRLHHHSLLISPARLPPPPDDRAQSRPPAHHRLFKKRRFRGLHETGVSMLMGMLAGFLIGEARPAAHECSEQLANRMHRPRAQTHRFTSSPPIRMCPPLSLSLIPPPPRGPNLTVCNT